MTLSIAEYLTRAGAIALLCEIDPTGSRYTELDEALPVSHDTLAKRLNEGVEVSLLEPEVEMRDKQGKVTYYMLTPKGATFRRALNESETTMAYRQYRKFRRQFKEKADDMRDWARTELPEFTDEHHEANLSLLQESGEFKIQDEE